MDQLRARGVRVLRCGDHAWIEAFERAIAGAQAMGNAITSWENRWSIRNLVDQNPEGVSARSKAGLAARALELTVVTARVDSRLTDRLLQRALSHHAASLVYIDPATFVEGGRRTAEIDAQLLRLDRAGIPIVVVHRGEDLAARLSGAGEPQRGSTAVAAAGVAGG